VDTDFSGDGHATVGAAGTLEEARASAIQNVNGEERILLGGWGRFSPIDSTGYNYVIARLCPDGTPDNGVNCSGDGFGQLGGIHMISFFDHLTGDHKTETITAITITQAESAACGDEEPTDKILVAGAAWPQNAASNEVWGLMRFCADGTLDTDWGGFTRDWVPTVPPLDADDAPGTRTISFVKSTGTHWMKAGEPFGLAVQADGKIVVGGWAHLPRDVGSPELLTKYFAVARLNADGSYDTSFGPDDDDDGRMHFDGSGGVDGDNVDDEIHAIQLIDDGGDADDILIAGTDRATDTATDRDMFVAQINWNGDGVSDTPWDWATTVDFDGKDDVGWDLVREPVSPFRLVIGGVTCEDDCPEIGATDRTPESDFAMARLESDGDLDTSFGTSGLREYDVEYTDIGYSMVLHQLPSQNPMIVIGGYSAENDSTPYMSGARFVFGGTGTPDEFRSDFSGSSGLNGDQAWELRVQPSDLRIVAGGIHTSSGSPTFAAIRLCKQPGEDPCEDPESAPTPGGNGGFNPEPGASIADRRIPGASKGAPDSPAPPATSGERDRKAGAPRPKVPSRQPGIDGLLELSFKAV
jgi:uncharacterized delta-60 repeat protein